MKDQLSKVSLIASSIPFSKSSSTQILVQENNGGFESALNMYLPMMYPIVFRDHPPNNEEEGVEDEPKQELLKEYQLRVQSLGSNS
jgi:hypothetical protein